MKKSNSNVKLPNLEQHRNGVHVFRWGFEEHTRKVPVPGEGGETVEEDETSFDYYEIFVENGTADRTTEAAIAALWGNGVEQKLTNDYLAAKEGVFTGEKATKAIAAYKEFLNERQALKEAVDAAYSE